VDPTTLEISLQALIEKSDEVVVTTFLSNHAAIISPSGEDVIGYDEGRVLRTFKGTHKVGDRVTFADPQGGIACGPGETGKVATTLLKPYEWQGTGVALALVFLRRTRTGDGDFPPGLRLTGSGVQGLFALPVAKELGPAASAPCWGIFPADRKQCNAALDEDTKPIGFGYKSDPLKETYKDVTVSQFLQEVQALADRLGYGQAAGQK
jgi:hypothetical protein